MAGPPYVRNIVFACPGSTWEDYQREGRALATFYAELLGMQIIRDDWFVVAPDQDTLPRLAFGDGPSDYRPPRWPDPDRPQQLHLDLPVSNLDSSGSLALRLGATPLQDKQTFRSYADPAGHPFCLYLDGSAPVQPSRVGRIVFDCLSPRALAAFYAQLLAMPVRAADSPNRVEIARTDGASPALAFQHASSVPPRWPDPQYPQQVHLDLHVEDPAAAGELVLRLGAIRLPDLGGSCPVYADPAAHPFCLCAAGQ